MAEPGTGELDRCDERADRVVLAEDRQLEIALERFETLAVRGRDAPRRNARDRRDDVLDVLHADGLGPLLGRLHLQNRARFVDHVDRLVRQMAVVDVLRRELRGRADRRPRVRDAVVLLVVGLQALQDLVRLLGRRLRDLDLLEAACERAVALEVALVVLVGRGPDAAHLAGSEHGLQDVGGVERPATRSPRPDDGVDLVDEEDGAGDLAKRGDHRLQTLLEVAAETGTGEQRAHVEGEDARGLERVRDAALVDLEREPLRQCRLADPGLADEYRVVLAAPAEHARGALELDVAADQRVDLAGRRSCDQVHGEEREGILLLAAAVFLLLFVVIARVAFGDTALLRDLRDAVRDVAHHVEPRDALLLEQIRRVGIGLAEDRDQHVAAEDLVLPRGLHVRGGALDDALEPQRLLGRHVGAVRQALELFVEEGLDLALQLGDVAAAMAYDLRDVGVVQQRIEHVLDAEELVAPPAGFAHREGETDLELSADAHQASSMLQRSGYSCFRANDSTCAIRVSAISRV